MQTTTVNLDRFRVAHLLVALMLTGVITASATGGLTQTQLITEVALLEDPSATFGIEDVVQGDFKSVSDTISIGYSKTATWLRMRILPAPDGSDVILTFASAVPDSLKLFAPFSAPFYDNATGFDVVHHEEISPGWPSPLPGYRFAPPEGGADYFVRIQSTGSIWLHMKAQPVAEAIASTERRYVTQIVYLTSMLIVMIWALHMFMVSGLNLFGWFTALQFVWVGNNLFYLGYADILFPFLSHETQMLLFRSSVFCGAFFSVIFHRAVMIRFEPSWLARRLFDAQLGVIGIAFVGFWTFDRVIALQVNAACLATMPIVFLANAMSARKNASPGFLAMRLVYGTLSLSFLLNSFAVLGLITSALLVQYGYFIHGALTAIVILLLLNAKVRDIFATARAAEIRHAEMDRKNQIEQEKTRALSQFIDMLGHEAKNALAVIRMSTPAHVLTDGQRARSDEAIRGLTNVLDRCNQVIRLDENAQTLCLEACDLTETLQRLCASADYSPRVNLKVHGTVIVHGDPILLDVVFGNLLDNSLKYSPPESEICVSLVSEDGGHSILFENAPGAAGAPDPKRVFERHYRGEYAKAEIGSGLGLYIVRGLLHLMGGKISYLPAETHIRFKVWIPC